MGVVAGVLTACLIGATVYTLSRALTMLDSATAAVIAVVAAACFLFDPYLAAHAVSGMETAPAAMVTSVFLLLLARLTIAATDKSRRWLALGLAATLVPMFRPEMSLAVVAVLATAALMSAELRPVIGRAAVVFLVAGAMYFAWRVFYYGFLLPLPFYLKQGPLGWPSLSYVMTYITHMIFLMPFLGVGVVFALAALATTAARERRRSVACLTAMLVAAGAQLAYYATIQHVMGFGFRFFIPISVAVVVLAFVGVAVVCDTVARSTRGVSWSVHSLVVGLLALAFQRNLIADGDAWHTFGGQIDEKRPAARAIAGMESAAKGLPLRIALSDCGEIPFRTGFSIVDLAGLNNRRIALARNPDAARVAARDEIRVKQPQLILLPAKRKNDRASVFEWERLNDADAVDLGYGYAGTIALSNSRAYGVVGEEGDGYHLLVYANGDRMARQFLDRLEQSGVIEHQP